LSVKKTIGSDGKFKLEEAKGAVEMFMQKYKAGNIELDDAIDEKSQASGIAR